MAEKELGYVELEWTCPSCGTRNEGSAPKCKQCGAAMPTDAKFEQAAEEKILTDETKIAAAKAAPDIYCAYCGTRNSSTAQVCKQCGAALSEGAARQVGGVLGGLRDMPAPPQVCPSCGSENPASAQKCAKCGAALGKAVPAAQPLPAKPVAAPRGLIIGAVVLLLLCLAIGGFMLFSASRTTDVAGQLVDYRWRRMIATEVLAPVTREDWRDRLPGGAEPQNCREKVREVVDQPQPGAREVCGTPYVKDTGTGYGKAVQDCQYEVLADYCQYKVLAWAAGPPLVLEGADLSPQWPAASNLGASRRLGGRSEEYVLTFRANDKEYTYTTSNFERFRELAQAQAYQLKINGLGQITEITLP
jgi:ribosomal protein L40E